MIPALEKGHDSNSCSKAGSSSSSCSTRPVSALRSLLWGFSDPQMEAKHRDTLHRATSLNVHSLVLPSAAMALVDVLRVIWFWEHLIKAVPFVVWALGYAMVDQIHIRQPHLFNTYVEAWPVLLLLTRVSPALWVAAGLPLRRGLLGMLPTAYGRGLIWVTHIGMPAFVPTRLCLNIFIWVCGAISLSLMEWRLTGSLQSALLFSVLPASVAMVWTAYNDYKGRVTLLRLDSRKPSSCSEVAHQVLEDAANEQPKQAVQMKSASSTDTSVTTKHATYTLPMVIATADGHVSNPSNAIEVARGHAVYVRQLARRMPASSYRSKAKRTTMRLKLPNAHPDELPNGWLQQLNTKMMADHNCSVVNVSVREGCIEVVLNLRPCSGASSITDESEVDEQAMTAAISEYLTDRLTKPRAAHPSPPPVRKLALHGPVPAPVLTHLTPCAVQLSYNQLSAPLVIIASGDNLHAPGVQILVTCQGRHLPVTITSTGDCRTTSSCSLTLTCPQSALPRGGGMIQVVARCGTAYSDVCAVLVLPNPGMVSEVLALANFSESQDILQGILQDLGEWIDLVQARSAAPGSSRAMDDLDIAAGSVDLSNDLGDLLMLNETERAMMPTAVDLLQYFCEIGSEYCACAMLSDLLKSQLGWSISPSDMWSNLIAPDEVAPSILELAAASSDSLAEHLAAIALSSGCYPPTRHNASDDVRYHPDDSFGRPSQTSNDPSRLPHVHKTARRLISALRSVLWGFPDPQMEARHRTSLHRASSVYLNLLAPATGTLAAVEVLRVVMSGESFIAAIPFLVYGLGYVAVNRICTHQPQIYNTYIEAWPVVQLIVGMFPPMWAAAGLPLRSGMVAMLLSQYGEAAEIATHVVMPAAFIRTRLLLSCVTFGITALTLSLVSLRLGSCATWHGLLLRRVLPCLLGLAWRVFSDYRGRVAIMNQSVKKQL